MIIFVHNTLAHYFLVQCYIGTKVYRNNQTVAAPKFSAEGAKKCWKLLIFVMFASDEGEEGKSL